VYILCPLSSCHLNSSRCHLGQIARYDTVSHFGWSVDARTHGIKVVIEKLLNEDWEPAVSIGREVPPMDEDADCVVSYSSVSIPLVFDLRVQDCFNWQFGDFKNPPPPNSRF
jgi:putative lipase involved disintegration of autophagic bodies